MTARKAKAAAKAKATTGVLHCVQDDGLGRRPGSGLLAGGGSRKCGPRIPEIELPVAVLLELLDAAKDQVALEAAEAVDEENAVEVVDLVEHGAG